MKRLVGLLLAFLVLTSSLAGVVSAADEQVIGRPELAVFAPDNVLVPGTDQTLSFFVANDGRLTRGGPAPFEARVTTARGVRVAPVGETGPLSVQTGTVPVGTVPDGTSGPFALRVSVAADAAPGTYEIPLELSYTYTRVVTYDETDPEASPAYAMASVTRPSTLVVRVENRPRFVVTDVASDVAVGSRGTVTVEMENVGTRSATDATVRLTSEDAEFAVAGGSVATVGVGEWAPGERRLVNVGASVAPDATVREYPLRLTVDYDDEDGIRRTTRTLTAAVRPQPRDVFELEEVTGALRVGRRGEVTGTFVNRRSESLPDATLHLVDTGSLRPTERTYPLGTVDAGERVPFAFTVDVPRNASAGLRALQFRVGYDAVEERERSDVITAVVDVSPYRDVFRVDAEAAQVTVDGDTTLVVRVTNVDDEPVADAVARLDVAEPLESDASEAFVGSLEPGESTTVAFALSATDDAIPSTLPATVRLTYTDTDGQDVVSDPAVVGVTVVEEESSLPVPVLVAVSLVLVGAAVWWWRRR